ncbi:MAG: 1,6-anhydro-N-acetylmuramyl-L-alanine amidase AmpD [Pseudomonadota bacterium]
MSRTRGNHPDFRNGWYSGARCVPSPNYDFRPDVDDISVIVIHAISLPPDTFGGDFVESFFCNELEPSAHPYFGEIRELQVSAHFYIKRSGELLQFVSGNHRGWHAGQSRFDGRTAVNDFSIGIELEGCDTVDFESVQYDVLATLVTALRVEYPKIDSDRIVGHSDIAPGRKTDPGPHFDWDRLRSLF